jgi:uncharacterized protein involved in exopolysaccharide biosynthesis/Mrp family chromosome partitioning ATPase
MALFFCGVVGLTLVVIALYPRSYSSEAKLFLRVGRESVALDPTATTGETIMLQKSQSDEINTALNILGSREVLQKAVAQVGAGRILADLPADGAGPAEAEQSLGVIRQASDAVRSCIGTILVSLRLSDPCSDEEMAVRRLQNGTTVWAPKESQVISITYSAASPELAHDVVDAISKSFLDEHLRLSHSEGSLGFFSEQVDNLQQELTAAQTELRDRKNEYQMTSVSGRKSVLENSKDALRQKIFDLSLQESELQSRYTDAYPPLMEIRRQKQEAAEALMGLPGAAGAGNVAGSSSATKANGSQLARELAMLNEQDYQLSQLERNVELLEGKYRMHVEKLEQARVNDAMGRDRLTNVKVAQAATLVRKPDAPKKQLLFALGLILATAGAIALAFLSEMLDQTLRTTDQVEAQLGLPVLLSLPRRKQHRRRSSSAGAAATNGHAKAEGNGHNGQQKHAGYRALVNEIMSSHGAKGQQNGDRHARTVGVVGCDTSKLRSKVAADLAIQAASSGSDPVLLIDADARRRRVTKRFHINGSPGWREVLAGVVNADSCVHRQEAGNLSVMSPGTPNGHAPVERPATGAFGQLNGIKSDYGLVVVDLPAARDLESTPPASEWLDEMVLVVEAERTRIQSAQRAKDMLERAGVHVTGVVLANRREHIPGWLYRRL